MRWREVMTALAILAFVTLGIALVTSDFSMSRKDQHRHLDRLAELRSGRRK